MNQSNLLQQSQDSATLGRFQLAKFSFAINSTKSKGPFTWSHIYGNDELVGLFESYVSPPPGKVMFKVISKNATLEEVDLTNLARELESQLQGNSTCSTFSLVVRRPCLAVKYPLSTNGRAYRFQIMFSSDEDYFSALAILNEMKCRFLEMNATSGRQSSRLHSSNLSSRDSLTISPSNSRPSRSMARPHSSYPAICAFPNRSIPSSSSSSVTLVESVRTFSSLNSSKAPTSAANAIPESNTSPITDCNKDLTIRPSTAIFQRDFEDLNLPPKRVLPFLNPAPKRTRKEPGISEAACSKISRPGPKSTPKTARSRAHTEEQSTVLSTATETYLGEQNTKASTTTTGTQTDTESFRACDFTSTDTLGGFLARGEKDRHAQLEETICNLINDDEFMQLCIALHKAWSRIAVGI